MAESYNLNLGYLPNLIKKKTPAQQERATDIASGMSESQADELATQRRIARGQGPSGPAPSASSLAEERRNDMAAGMTPEEAEQKAAERARQRGFTHVSAAEKQQKKSAATRETIAQDIRAGQALGQEFIPEGSLGRIGEDKGIQSSIARLQDLSQGMGAKETEAKRAEAFRGIEGATGSQSRALQAALSRAGVKGGAAGAQLRDVALGGIEQKAQVERQLFLEDRGMRERGLDRLLQAQSGVAQFDIGKAAQEKLLGVQGGLAFAQIGAAERGGSLAAKTTLEAARLGSKAQLDAANIAGGSSGGGCF